MVSLYLHIPFCLRKCKYCDFVSYAGCEALFDAYLDRLLQEMEPYRGTEVRTVFLGGGTPSLLRAEQARRLLEAVGRVFRVQADAEWSIECNPCSVTAEKLRVYRDGGVNRVSIGLQSSWDHELRMLGRSHSYAQFLQAYAEAARVFENLNVDVISGLPGQTPEEHLQTLRRVTALAPRHISCYSLIVAEGTPLAEEIAQGKLQPIPEEQDRAIYQQTKDFLEENGYLRYEISNFAQRGWECRHNLQYWLRGDYIGLGCAAHSFLNGWRVANPEGLKAYLQGAEPIRQQVPKEEAIEETLMLGLRLSRGVSLKDLQTLGCDLLKTRAKQVERLRRLGLIELQGDFLRLTDEGCHVANAVTVELI